MGLPCLFNQCSSPFWKPEGPAAVHLLFLFLPKPHFDSGCSPLGSLGAAQMSGWVEPGHMSLRPRCLPPAVRHISCPVREGVLAWFHFPGTSPLLPSSVLPLAASDVLCMVLPANLGAPPVPCDCLVTVACCVSQLFPILSLAQLSSQCAAWEGLF